MLIGIAGLALAIACLVLLRRHEVRVRRRHPVQISSVRAASELVLDDVHAALRARGLRATRHDRSVTLRGERFGRSAAVRFHKPGELAGDETARTSIASNDYDLSAEVLLALVARFGTLTISIPVESAVIELAIYPLDHPRVALVIDDRLAVDTLARRLETARVEYQIEIDETMKIRIQLLEHIIKTLSSPAPPQDPGAARADARD